MMLAYQNCGGELQDSMFDELGGASDIYEVKIDQIAYMSCSEQKNVINEQKMFFTFRAGAYGENAGLRINPTFLQRYKNIKKNDLMDKLMEDTVFAGSQIQFSIRKQTDLSQMFIGGSSSEGVEGIDYDFTFGLLGSEELSASLITTNSTFSGWLNYFAAAGVNFDAYLEGSLTFNESENIAGQVRNFFENGGGMLTTVFGNLDKPTNIRIPNYSFDDDPENDDEIAPSNEAIGVGLKLTFKQPNALNWTPHTNPSPYTGMPKRVLATVTEVNLASPRVSSGVWTCPNSLQLRIVYNAASHMLIGGVHVCDYVEDPDPMSDELKTIRKSLPASDWYVDLAHRCVIPRRVGIGSCYGIDSGVGTTRQVNYDFTTACNPDVVNNAAAVCPHFVSICVKTQ